jgi:hypothetical protein
MGEVVMEGLKKSNRNILYDNAPIMDSKTNEILIIRKMWENIQFLNVLVDEDIVKINNEKIKEIDYYINISINNETIY